MKARHEAPSAGTRTNSGWLSAAEGRALAWLTPRTPLWLSPDRLTALGLGGAVLALAGYLLAARYPVALWLVNVGLGVNWLGDSLDGHVARARRIERPVYGFFLDQSIDVIGCCSPSAWRRRATSGPRSSCWASPPI